MNKAGIYVVNLLTICFFNLIFSILFLASNLRQGAQALMQCSGLGKLRPNIVILGFKSDWESDSIDKIDEYINIIHDSFDAKFNVAILRMPMGMNYF